MESIKINIYISVFLTIRIPFLIPYEVKNTSFDKTVVNKYVLFL